MSKIFLLAEWRNLLMANYEVPPSLLKKYLPYRTELDDFNSIYYVSIVGFLFTSTRVRGIAFPFHKTFEEVNLRFYVRHKEGAEWKRGVVFIKELVPKRMITFIANTIYKEKYATHRMKHLWETNKDLLKVEYYYKAGKEWNYLKAVAQKEPQALIPGSEEEFITEHYWGYTFINDANTGIYEVTHPRWNIHPVQQYDIKCNAALLYGSEWNDILQQAPRSVFLADGSAIQVMKGSQMIR